MKNNQVLKIDENYSVKKDAYSFNLVREEVKGLNPETGKQIISKETTYHKSLFQALSYYLKGNVDLSGDCQAIINQIKQSEENILKATGELKK